MNDRGVGLHHVEHVMGMAVSIDIRDPECPPGAIGEVVAWLHHVDATFSTYIPESPVSAIGRGELAIEDASEEIQDVLRMCDEIKTETGGVFDVFAVPAPNGTHFDPSGLVKGWAIEGAASLLEGRGCANFCLNAGGDVALRGRSHGDAPWKIGIRHPFVGGALALIVEHAGPIGVATSATYERGTHIVDPRTGLASLSLASVTIVGPDLSIADAYATAVFVMGVDGLDWIEGRPGYDAYVITNDSATRWTPGFNRYRPAASAQH